MAGLKLELEALVTIGEAKMKADAAEPDLGDADDMDLDDGGDVAAVGGEGLPAVPDGKGRGAGGGRRWSEDERKVRREMKEVRERLHCQSYHCSP